MKGGGVRPIGCGDFLRRLVRPQQTYEAGYGAASDHTLHAVVRAVAQVRHRPARVCHNLVVGVLQQTHERGQAPIHLLDVHKGFAAAKVRHGPNGVAQQRQLRVGVRHDAQQRVKDAEAKDVVAAERGVAGDVAQGPDALLAYVVRGAVQQLDEQRHGVGLDHEQRVVGRAGGDVGEGPGGLHLQVRGVAAAQELHQAGDHAAGDDLVDRRVGLDGQELADHERAADLRREVVRAHHGHHVGQLLQRDHDAVGGVGGHATGGHCVPAVVAAGGAGTGVAALLEQLVALLGADAQGDLLAVAGACFDVDAGLGAALLLVGEQGHCLLLGGGTSLSSFFGFCYVEQ
eukprot:PhM_4_TR13959/c1_g1_i5/m.31995